MLFQDVANNPRELLAMTGYTLEEFKALIPWFKEGLDDSKLTLEGSERKNQLCNYKNSPLPTLEDRLFFILIYAKQYQTQIMHGKNFGMSQPKANQWIHFLFPALQSALSKAGASPCREMEKLPPQDATVFAHDGTERPILRPKDNELQKESYSGKQKKHTVKNNVLADENCKVIYLTPTVEGKKHDKKLADESGYVLPKGSTLLQDTGFQGFTVEGVSIVQPKKKPRGKELTQDEKDSNRAISKVRVRIEHVINGVKRYRIVKDTCRNWLKGFKDRIMEVACGLHNFRLNFRPWKAIKFPVG
jgi:hypothetical protein